MSLFEINSNLNCRFVQSPDKEKLIEGNFYIERAFDRKSSTGATDYNVHRVLDHNLLPAKIAYGCAKLVAVSTEYWWSLGSFSQEEENIFIPNSREFVVSNHYPTFKTGPRVCMYINYMHWVISRAQFGNKCCLLAVEDEEGIIARIPSFFSDSNEIQQSLLYLIVLNDFKKHVTAKLFWILSQLQGISTEGFEDKARLKKYVESTLKPLYNSSLNTNQAVHEADPAISSMYNALLQLTYA